MDKFAKSLRSQLREHIYYNPEFLENDIGHAVKALVRRGSASAFSEARTIAPLPPAARAAIELGYLYHCDKTFYCLSARDGGILLHRLAKGTWVEDAWFAATDTAASDCAMRILSALRA